MFLCLADNNKLCKCLDYKVKDSSSKLGNKDVDTVFGTPVAPQGTLSHANNQENAPDVGGGNKSLFLFKHNDCSPECCDFGKGTDVSCSGGCVCYNKEQNNKIII